MTVPDPAGDATAAADRRRRGRRLAALIAAGGGVWALFACLFVVDVTAFGVVSRFGEVVRAVERPGLYLKAPFDKQIPVASRLLLTTPEKAEFLTLDKKNVVVRTLVTWRIGDPKRYLETLADRAVADLRLSDIVLGNVGSALGVHRFGDLISAGAGAYAQLVGEIRDRTADVAAREFGIDIVDIDIRRFTLPDQNRTNVFDRMKAERGRIAKQYRSEGRLESTKIIADADRQAKEILAEADRAARLIRAEGEAEAMRIYAAAFGQDADFYKFLRTLDAYRAFLDDSTTIFLPADAELFRLLGHGEAPFAGGAAPSDPAPDDTVAERGPSDLFSGDDETEKPDDDAGPPG